MAVREILQIGNPILRKHSIKVSQFDGALSQLVQDMFETMRAANGVGLAAPQIGVSSRVIVIEMPEDQDDPYSGAQFALCNPKIVKASRETEIDSEGCLSVLGYVGQVERPVEIVVSGQDMRGKNVRYKVDGYLARAFQHEIDHLNGVLYVDIAQTGSVQAVQKEESNAEPEAAI